MPLGGSLGVINIYHVTKIQGNSSSRNGLIEVERKNFDLEYLR
jgi:hypothetical protein